LQAGRVPDQQALLAGERLPRGALRIGDLAYFDLGAMAAMDRDGVYWLSRYSPNTIIWTADGARWKSASALLKTQGRARVDVAIRRGAKGDLACRLLAERVPAEVAEKRRQRLRKAARDKGYRISEERLARADWTICVTTCPPGLLSVAEAMVLGRSRWQIELLFKRWKSHGRIDEWRSGNPQRILCEVYAKLLAMLVQHWLTLVGSWSRGDRSLWKAAGTIRRFAWQLAGALGHRRRLHEVLHALKRCLESGCRMNPRKKAPNTDQRLLNVAPEGLT
jgi:hypothetical protein